MGLLDIFFPKRCIGCKRFGSYICTNCFISLSFAENQICAVCNRSAFDGITHPGCKNKYAISGILASMSYSGLMKRLIYQFKYKPYLTDLKNSLGELFFEGLIQKEQFYKILTNDTIIVPIPLHKDKLRSRGYNQAEILSKLLGARLNLPVKDLLIRQKKTTSQFQLTRDKRVLNIKDAFTLKNFDTKLDGKTIFLVDDVTTSGVTLLEAAKVLKKARAKEVWGLALAHGS